MLPQGGSRARLSPLAERRGFGPVNAPRLDRLAGLVASPEHNAPRGKKGIDMNEFTGKPFDPSREKRVLIDLTEYEDGMQISPARIKHYPISAIREALAWGADDCAEYCDDIISGRAGTVSGVSLASWLDIHCPDDGKVWRKK